MLCLFVCFCFESKRTSSGKRFFFSLLDLWTTIKLVASSNAWICGCDWFLYVYTWLFSDFWFSEYQLESTTQCDLCNLLGFKFSRDLRYIKQQQLLGGFSVLQLSSHLGLSVACVRAGLHHCRLVCLISFLASQHPGTQPGIEMNLCNTTSLAGTLMWALHPKGCPWGFFTSSECCLEPEELDIGYIMEARFLPTQHLWNSGRSVQSTPPPDGIQACLFHGCSKFFHYNI